MINDRQKKIENALQAAFPLDVCEIRDDSALHAGHKGVKQHGGGHFHVELVSAAFANKTPVERHQMVYRALSPLMKHEIHALSILALTPEER